MNHFKQTNKTMTKSDNSTTGVQRKKNPNKNDDEMKIQ